MFLYVVQFNSKSTGVEWQYIYENENVNIVLSNLHQIQLYTEIC